MSDRTEAQLLALYDLVEKLISEADTVVRDASASVQQVKKGATYAIDDLARKSAAEIRRIDSSVETILKPGIEIARQEKQDLIIKGWWWFILLASLGAVIGLGLMLFGYYFYVEDTGKHKAYWEQERGAVFGARVVSNENGDFVVFDKDYKVGPCTKDNCISIQKVERSQ